MTTGIFYGLAIVYFFVLVGIAGQFPTPEKAPIVVEIIAPNGNNLSFGVDRILRVSAPDRSRFNFIKFQVDEITATAFGKLTYDNLGRQISIKICGKQVSNPVIRDPLFGGVMAVEGGTRDKAKVIVDVLAGRRSCP